MYRRPAILIQATGTMIQKSKKSAIGIIIKQ